MLFTLLNLCFLYSGIMASIFVLIGGVWFLVGILIMNHLYSPHSVISVNQWEKVGDCFIRIALIAAVVCGVIAILLVLTGGGTNAL